MLKEIYIFKGGKEKGYDSFSRNILELGRQVLSETSPLSLKVTLTTRRPPALSVIPFRREKAAVFSMSGRSKPFPATPGGLVLTGSYAVEEAIPVAYEKTWNDGEPTPGICLLTLFHQKPGIDRDTFMQRWFKGHTPLSLRLHPLWNYNRNVVLETLTDGSQWYDGIVEEQFRTRKELLDPFRFFGPPLKVPRHMMEVWKDTRSFIDMKRIETYLATENILKSPQL